MKKEDERKSLHPRHVVDKQNLFGIFLQRSQPRLGVFQFRKFTSKLPLTGLFLEHVLRGKRVEGRRQKHRQRLRDEFQYPCPNCGRCDRRQIPNDTAPAISRWDSITPIQRWHLLTSKCLTPFSLPSLSSK